MGWLALFLIVAVAAGALWALRLPRATWMMAGSAAALGCAGYALQGRPLLPAAAPRPQQSAADLTPDFAGLRAAMWGGEFTRERVTEVPVDAMLRQGARRPAVLLALGGVQDSPRSARAWTLLGSAYVAHDDAVSPPALFAFRRAIALAPRHPAPRFFLGLGYLQAGDLASARAQWAAAVALTPAKAPYRAALIERLSLLDQLARMASEQQLNGQTDRSAEQSSN